MILTRLAWSHLKVRRTRTILTTTAMAMAVALVVVTTSGFLSSQMSAVAWLNHYMGAADTVISGDMPEDLVRQLQADPDVARANGRLETGRWLPRAADGALAPAPTPGHTDLGVAPNSVKVQLIGVRMPGDTAAAGLNLPEGRWFTSATGNEAVVDEAAEDQLGVSLGKSLEIPGINGAKLTLQIVGILHRPKFFNPGSCAVYLPMETLQLFLGHNHPPRVSRIDVNLRGGVNFDVFRNRWTARLAGMDRSYHLRMRRDSAGDLDRKLRVARLLSYMAGAVAMLTAMFIIFSSLSMGVTERQRTLAMLRAVGAERTQVFGMVILESLALGIVGTAVGIGLGMALVVALCRAFPAQFTAGVFYSAGGIAFATAGSLVTALAASLLPAWWASRVSPLAAMNAWTEPHGSRVPWRCALGGLGLISIDPLLFFGPLERSLRAMGLTDADDITHAVRFWGHFFLGLPGIMVGFFLLSPMLVWLVDHAFSPLMAWALGVPGTLLKRQLSAGIWRAAGTATALMVGLSVLIALQVQGNTLIGGWQLPDRFPDIYIYSSDTIAFNDLKPLEKLPEIQPGTLMPVVVTTTLGDSKTALFLRGIAGQDVGMMFFAVDPDQAIRMIDLNFRDDDGVSYPPAEQVKVARQAADEMRQGRHVIISDDLRQSRHLKIGDTLPVLTGVKGEQTYTICGIIWPTGADVVVNMFDMSQMIDQQTMGSVLISLEDAKHDFGVTGVHVLAANLRSTAAGEDKAQLLEHVQKILNAQGLVAGDVRVIKAQIEHTFYNLLDLISTIAIAALAVASLGVANTVMASIRSRRWQFGILRSLGLERWALLKLVLAEAALLGIVGAAMGLGAGLELAVDARQLAGTVLGYSPAMLIPWGVLGAGCLAVLGVSIGASLGPAIRVARSQPLTLLQAGRSAI